MDAKPTVIVINYQAVWRGSFGDWVKSVQWDCIVADEVHKLKSPGSQQGRFFRRAYRHSSVRLGLSGTPLSNGMLTDAYGQFAFLDPGVFGCSMARFKQRYAVMSPYVDHKIDGWQNTEEFYRKFWSITRHEDRAVLNLPDATDVTRKGLLSTDARKIYNEMEATFVADLGDGDITIGVNAAVRVGKLMQIANGSVFATGAVTHLTGGEQAKQVHTDKQKMLVDVLDDTQDEPTVIFAKYRADIRQCGTACDKVGRTWGELSGQDDDLRDWQKGEFDVLVVQIDSGSEGISLVRARYGIFYSISHSLSTYEQARARLHRPGMEGGVTFIHLSMVDTVDEHVMLAIERKADIVRSVIEAYEA